MTKTFMLVFAVLCLGVSGVQATPILYNAVLSGSNEVPPNLSPGTGTGAVSYDPVTHTLSIMLDFSGLTGTTTAAHIHCCAAPGTNAGVATPTPTFPGFPAGVMAGIYNQIFDLTLTTSFNNSFINANGGTVAGAEAALATGLADGKAYFNIHTTFSPGGEIRGNLMSVPEPTTLALMGLGLACIGYRRRSNKLV